jgi:hypothetical protein
LKDEEVIPLESPACIMQPKKVIEEDKKEKPLKEVP